MSCPRQHFH
uniref:Uncharacterized protein n=1 Tax=Arundo donax TaxID=35708 RepID=A0A0A9HKQ7_ARUDO